jgi:hypothetical protein
MQTLLAAEPGIGAVWRLEVITTAGGEGLGERRKLLGR